eukprot:6210941-Alexandrium_andersonii.AAC.1
MARLARCLRPNCTATRGGTPNACYAVRDSASTAKETPRATTAWWGEAAQPLQKARLRKLSKRAGSVAYPLAWGVCS